jgi:AcrR family transcriptional regulator
MKVRGAGICLAPGAALTIHRRAITTEQRQERRAALIAQAWALFQEREYAAINILDVARSAGLAKGTLYLYFSTKEELFLSVMVEQLANWFDRLGQRLEGLARDAGPAGASVEEAA